MAGNGMHPTSAELQRDVERQRERIESRLDAIQARLSPGQLVDEALAFTREGPGAEFAGNLRRSVVHNPLPIALMSVGLAWLMAKPGYESRRHDGYDEYEAEFDDFERHPIGTVQGRSLQRVGLVSDTSGIHHSEFVDDAGRKYRARSDQHGNRAGHFTDEAGKSFRGFMDDTGNHLTEFRDEAGNLMGEATGWANHTWHQAGRGMQGARDRLTAGAGDLRGRAMHAGGTMQHEAGRLAGSIDGFIHRQPLVSGAIAFAIGAAIASALPHTREEDELMGETSDAVKDEARREAGHLYDRGKDEAEHLYDEASQSAERAYDKAKGAVGSSVDHMSSDQRTHN
jgi:ElaB/YqjD/DUF883 family membrane-anchored ribosome-binding protein/uncharacterized protein YjbJ (UPF0337 family)